MLHRILRLPGQVISNSFNWLRINLSHLAKRAEYQPPKNGRPTVLIALAEPGHPYYESWRAGIEANGWNVIWLPRSYELHFSHQLFLYLALCRRVQVVHLIDVDLWTMFGEHNRLRTWMSFAAIRLIIAWPKLLGKRVIYSFGNIVPHEFDTPAERRRHQLICSRVDDVISLSPSQTEALLQDGIANDHIWPVEHADIADYFTPTGSEPDFRASLGIPQDATVLLCIGSIRPYKGFEVAIEGFKRTLNPNLRLVIAGKPSAGYTAQDITRLADSDPRIIFGPLRILTNAEMGWMFAGSDYCVLSYRAIGHSGLVCQAMGLGAPVIAARVGCLPDYVCSGAGLLFEPGDADDLARVIEEELPHFDRQRGSQIARALMAQRTPERIGRRMVRLYEHHRGGPEPEREWLF